MPDSPSLTDRAVRLVSQLRRGPSDARPSTRRLLLGLSVVVLAASLYIAFANLPDVERDVSWWPLVGVALIGVPALLALNAAEYVVSASMLGHRIPLRESLVVAVLARTANLLPVPGSMLVRTRALKGEGSNYRQAIASTTAVGIIWLGSTGVLIGAWQLADGRPLFGGASLAGGLVATGLAHVMIARLNPDRPWRFTALAFVVESAMVMVKAVRFHFVLIGLDLAAPFAASVALTASGVISSAFGFFPEGMGIRELVAAGVSPLVGIPAATGLVATGIDRIAAFPIFISVAVWLAIRGEGDRHRLDADDLDADDAADAPDLNQTAPTPEQP